jgi:hypothetical protein
LVRNQPAEKEKSAAVAAHQSGASKVFFSALCIRAAQRGERKENNANESVVHGHTMKRTAKSLA